MTDDRLIIVGGGPVGLVTALHAARAGLRVTVCEPRAAPIDKACGEGLMPSGVAALAALGVDPAGSPITGIRYLSAAGRPRREAQASFRDAPGRGIRRTVLHAALWEAAQRAGVDLVPATVAGLDQHETSVRVRVADPGANGRAGRELRASYVIAADGLHSQVRRMLDLDAPVHRHRRYGLRRHVAIKTWTNQVEVYWSGQGEAYLTPVGADMVGVALLSGGGASFEQQLGAYPALLERLGGAQFVTPVRGAGPFRQRSRRRVAGRVLLVGDASGYVDALTGEGLSVGFAQARSAVEAVCDASAQRYERHWREITNPSTLTAAALVTATRRAPVRRALVPLARQVPSVFEAAVNALR